MAAAVTETLRDLQLESEPDVLTPAFFRLPPELRIDIYRMALVEPPMWQKRHNPMCLKASLDSETLEWPPFIRSALRRNSPNRCQGCVRRHSINLLAVNRQIHREAAPIFWSENQFVFLPFETFVQDVGQNLRPEYQQLLRHVLFLTDVESSRDVPTTYWARTTSQPDVEALWNLLPQCSGLQSVAMPYKLLSSNIRRYRQLRHNARQLVSFRLVSLFKNIMNLGANIQSPEPPYDPELPLMPLEPDVDVSYIWIDRFPSAFLLFFLVGLELDINAIRTPQARHAAIHDYAVTFQQLAVDVIKGPNKTMTTRWDEATRHQQVETRTSQRAVPGSFAWYLRRQTQRLPRVGLSGSYSEFFRLDNGSDCEFHVLGLAPSEELRLCNKRLRRQEKKELWCNGFMDFRRSLDEFPVRPWHRDWVVRQRIEEEKAARTRKRKLAEKQRLERDRKAQILLESQSQLSETQRQERKRLSRKKARGAEEGDEADGESNTARARSATPAAEAT